MRSDLDPTPAPESSAPGASGRAGPAIIRAQGAADRQLSIATAATSRSEAQPPGAQTPAEAQPPAETPAGATSATGPLPPGADPAAPRPEMPHGTAALDVVCPYLRSADGTWRSIRPQRDHRCWAQSPPAVLPTLTQEDLCLTAAHTGCPFYGAELQRRAQELARDRIAPERLSRSRFGALVQPVPLAIDLPGENRFPALPEDRARLVGAALVGILAFVILAGGIYVFASHPAATPPIVGLASPTGIATAPLPTTRSTPATTLRPTLGTTPPPTTVPSLTPGPSTTPAIARTYRVRPGDTVGSIARRFRVTKAALLAVNDLGSPPALTPGQSINIPA